MGRRPRAISDRQSSAGLAPAWDGAEWHRAGEVALAPEKRQRAQVSNLRYRNETGPLTKAAGAGFKPTLPERHRTFDEGSRKYLLSQQ